MARQALVIDASVGVKWFSTENEASVAQARAILDAQANGTIDIVVPDIFFHEISNALVSKRTIPLNLIEASLSSLFNLRLSVCVPDEALFLAATRLARKNSITEYDACYVAIAINKRCPLVTANPRHQKRDLGCHIIPIEDWR